MQALTGHARNKPIGSTSKKKQKPPSLTASRIVAHSDQVAPGDWRSASRNSFSAPGRVASALQVGSMADREAKIHAEIAAEIRAENAAKEAKQREKDRRGRYETTSSDIVGSSNFGSIGRRVMKTRSGGPVHGLDDAGYEFGLHQRKSKISDAELLKGINTGSYLTDQPISLYTQKAAEGSIPTSMASKGGNIFARSTQFTNEITDTNKMSTDPADQAGRGAVGNGGKLTLLSVMDRIKESLRKRSGTGNNGIAEIARLFKIMDDSGDKKISRSELKYGLRDMGIPFSSGEEQVVFTFLDRDGSGTINFDEFLRALANEMNAKRLALVKLAYQKLDSTGDGLVTTEDIKNVYDVSQNPEVISGKITADEAFAKFMKQWETDKVDGIVTLDEFTEYYRNVSPSIDRDDYFELMMRNAWHLPGGVGAAANTTCRRVMVTQRDGTQSVQTLKDDLGIHPRDFDRIRAALHWQGVHNVVVIANTDGSKKVWK